MIELEALGAAREVTGSRHLLRTSRARVLLDCGLFQGHRAEANAKNRELGLDARELDAVVLSHAHLDHSGALPMLIKEGFTGSIYATPATRDLCAPMLADAANVQRADARHIATLIERGVDLRPVTPLYDQDDVTAALAHVVGLPYHRRHPIAPGVALTFLDAGHVLGSAITVLDIDDDGARTRLAFTGDLGRPDLPILRSPEVPDGVHCLISESTYGDRTHPPIADSRDQLARAIGRTVARGGKIVVPSFALERAQELLYTLRALRVERRIPAVPIYLDSPLAIRLTDIFRLHPDCYDADARELLRGDHGPFDVDGLIYVNDAEDSKAIDASASPAIVIAGSGMCEGGRVLHHLRAAVEDPRNTIALVGFQAEHTLGRRIAERRPSVRIFGVMRELHAEVVALDGFSAHADRGGLVAFAEDTRARGPLRQVVLVHGEPPAQEALAAALDARHFPRVVTPARGERVRV